MIQDCPTKTWLLNTANNNMTKEEFNIPDAKLIRQFITKERSKVLAVLRNRLSVSTEDAEDIFQDACIALFNNIQNGKLKTLTCSLSTYFTQICLNMGYDFVNRGHSTTSFDQMLDNTIYDEYGLRFIICYWHSCCCLNKKRNH